MKLRTKTLLASLTASAMLAGSASAATIGWDFNDNNAVVDTNELFGDGVTANNVAISSTGNVITNIDMQRAQRTLGGTVQARTGVFAFTINVGATPIDLTNIAFDYGVDSDAGSVTQNHIRWDLAVTTTGSETPGLSQTFGADTVTGSRADVLLPESVSLSGLEGIANTSVTFTFTLQYGANNDVNTITYQSGQNSTRWVVLDNLVITGTVVPEPGSLALLGLGGLLIGARRRRD